ncbi:hypothetical protein VI03_30460, partial [Burkholderia vietnamiensis]|uniref:hypothetical protein n=1 Tax=Burkholderia vietnamiensis TaxID=60552 RepID=UPI0006225A7B
DAAGGARARARASATAGACAEPGMDACRTRGHGRRFARSRFPTASAAGDRCDAFGCRCVAF